MFVLTKRNLHRWVCFCFFLMLHIANGERSHDHRPISNYDYYKPLHSPERGRFSYSEDDDSPEEGGRNWLKKDNYETEIDDDDYDKPVYGYNVKEQRDSRPKDSNSDPIFNDNKQGYFSDWTYSKLNGWQARGKATPLSSQNERDSPYKLTLDSPKEKETDYQSTVTYSGNGKHPNQAIWNTDEGSRSANSSYNYKSENTPRRPNNVQLDVRVHKERPVSYSKQYEDSPILNKPKYKSHVDVEEEAERAIRNVEVRNKYLGKNERYPEDPISDQVDSGEKVDFIKEIRKQIHAPKIIPDFTSRFNHGGHSYGMAYTPKKDMSYLTDSSRKSKFLQEHEKKLEEMQKKHRESFDKFMGKPLLEGRRKFGGFRNQALGEIRGKFGYDSKYHLEPEYPAEAEQSPVFIKV
ncbi:hypothetical protein JTE90_016037 [Oedothorax gibbosus]|uniref:Uncharacterized protein n=1 Tax=Oedothorax gibbosus TaxID=931172 RepID=A0AAV6VTV1_9ARAC|nr:hypothetical protein JTE90_016037 [Oedothorax gibbosus]